MRTHALPVQIAFRELQPTLAAQRDIHRRVRQLVRAFPELRSCRVEVDAGDERDRCHVRIDMTVPGGRVGVKSPRGRRVSGEVKHLVRDAFDRAWRGLLLSRRRSQVPAASRLF
jgi:hypothetical protein